MPPRITIASLSLAVRGFAMGIGAEDFAYVDKGAIAGQTGGDGFHYGYRTPGITPLPIGPGHLAGDSRLFLKVGASL